VLLADGLNRDRRALSLLEIFDAARRSGLSQMGDAGLWPD
jgi:hypothetical protein